MATPPHDLDAFARWAFGTVLYNTHRGWYAEWLVRNAVGDPALSRFEWAPADIITPDLKVEVKTTGLVQAWNPTTRPGGRPRPPGFDDLRTKRWTGVGNEYTSHPMVVADVYVFAVHTCTDRAVYNVGDPAQWEFYVTSGVEVHRWNQNSISLPVLKRKPTVAACAVSDLPVAIRAHADPPDSDFDWSVFLRPGFHAA